MLRSAAGHGKTVLVTTHLVAEWNEVAHRCLLCREGKIARELDPTNLPHNFDEPLVMTAPANRPDNGPLLFAIH
jgi:ABC-type multidrug transport system ATPase subunit